MTATLTVNSVHPGGNPADAMSVADLLREANAADAAEAAQRAQPKAAPDPAALIASAEQQFNLPPGLLAAHRQVESSNGANLHSGQADGSMQLRPATARALGVDPMDDTQAIPAAAKLIRANLDASGGDIDHATKMYFGGPNQANWGPLTNAYPGKILKALQSQGPNAPIPATDTSDPYEAALAGTSVTHPQAAAAPAQSATSDPFEAALMGGNAGNGPDPLGQPAAPLASVAGGVGASFGAGPSVANGAPADGGMGPQPGPASSLSGLSGSGQGTAGASGGIPGSAPGSGTGRGATPVSADAGTAVPMVSQEAEQGAPWSYDRLKSFGRTGADMALYAANGIHSIPQGATALVAQALDKIGLTHGFGDTVANQQKSGQAATDALAFDPKSGAATIGQLAGEMFGTLPIGAVGWSEAAGKKIIENAAELGRLAPAGVKWAARGIRAADAAIQGAIGGAVTNAPGSDPTGSATLGAGVGTAVGMVSRPVARAFQALSPHAETLANAFARVTGREAPKSAVAEAIKGNLPDTSALAGAVSSGGARRGLISNTNLPAPVIAHTRELVAQGVPVDHALREAEITHLGASPTVANTTRNFADQQATNEGAKITTPEGRALMEQQTGNNAAAHRAVSALVEKHGGIPAKGDAMGSAAQSLAAASDAAKAKVSGLYKTAEQAAGMTRATVDAKPIADLLNDPEMRSTVTTAGGAFTSGMSRRLSILTDGATKPLDAAKLEQLRKAANDAYDPMGGEVNNLAGRAKGAIDKAFDDLGTTDAYRAAHAARALGLPVGGEANLLQDLKAARAAKGLGLPGDHDSVISDIAAILGKPVPLDASAAYKAARAGHKQWADTYDIPGISDLIQRDAKGAFVGASAKLDRGLLGGMDDRPFVNTVNQLKANGDTATLGKLKASVVQDAYEATTRTSQDAGGHAPLNGRLFLQNLDKIGAAKLDALFSADELGNMAAIGRGAMHLNDPSPGAVNNSSTSSAAMNTLREAMIGAKDGGTAKKLGLDVMIGTAAQGLGHAVAPGVGGVAVGAGISGLKLVADAVKKKASAGELAAALKAASSPATARAQATERNVKLAQALIAMRNGSAVARSAAPAGTIVNRRGD